MIDFRYHVVSIVAVFLALALGLFIGSTTLRGPVATDLKNRADQVSNTNNRLQGELSATHGELSRWQAFDNALLPYAVANRLTGESVITVSAPGVDGSMRSRITSALTQAGATLTGDVRLQASLLDPSQDQFLTTLTGKLTPPNRALRAGSGSERALALLADVLGTKPLGSRPQQRPLSPSARARVLSAYSAANLLSISGPAPRPAALALLISAAGPSGTGDQAAAAGVSLLGEFAADLDRAATGTVATGPASAADDGGLLAEIRGDKTLRSQVSTVDSAELPNGVIATVLALAEQATGQSGSYGVAPGADQPLPSPSPS